MAEEAFVLKIAHADREALVLCLTMGTLEAMRGEAWPLEAGIWTLARPVFWEALTGVDDAVIQVLKSADELDALAELCGRSAADEALDRMIATVRARLAALPEKRWDARW